MQESNSIVICKKCAALLVLGDMHWTCSNCGASYSSVPGLVWINPSPYYWGEICQDAMHLVLLQERRSSWRDAVALAVEEYGWKSAKRTVFGSGRCDWFPEVPYRRGMRVLDIGSGWGNLSFLLSQHVAEVYSLEGVIERADFQQIRFCQEQIGNITVVNSDFTILPFKPASFDLVILNGVLEWIGLADLSRNTRQVQLSILEDIIQLLKPGGYLYVGIENRVSVSAIRGSRDHSGMPYTSLLPRRLANLVMKVRAGTYCRADNVKSDSYRTYTYTPRGYKKLLNQAGFFDVRLSWVMPGYNAPYHSARFESANTLRFYARQEASRRIRAQIKRRIVNVASRCGLAKYLMPMISIVAGTKGGRSLTLLEEICRRLRAHGYSVCARESLRYTKTSSEMSMRAKILYILFDKHTREPALAAKFPRTRRGVQILQEEERVFSLISARWPRLNEIRRARYLHVDDLIVLCEHFFAGSNFVEHLLSSQAYDAATDWLTDFQAAKSDNAQMLSVVDSAWTAVENLCVYDFVDPTVKNFLRRWFEVVSKNGDVQTPSVPVHGDFCSGNILLSNGELFVTDWEWIKPEGGPWEDFCIFLMSSGFNTSPNGSNRWRRPENLLASLQGKSVHSDFISKTSGRFLKKGNLSSRLLTVGFLATLACRVIRDFEQHGISPSESAHYQFLSLAAQGNIPLWKCFAHLLSTGKTS